MATLALKESMRRTGLNRSGDRLVTSGSAMRTRSRPCGRCGGWWRGKDIGHAIPNHRLGELEMKNLLIAGGAGFIGSNFVHGMLRDHPEYRLVVYDKMTYAGNPDNLADIAADPRYAFVLGDICDADKVRQTIREHRSTPS